MVQRTPVHGFPWVEPSDTPVTYPTISQELATDMETALALAVTTVSPATNWVYDRNFVRKVGSLVTVSVSMKNAVAAGITGMVVGTLPAGYCPIAGLEYWTSFWTITATTKVGTMSVSADGTLKLRGSVMPAANEQLGVHLTFPIV